MLFSINTINYLITGTSVRANVIDIIYDRNSIIVRICAESQVEDEFHNKAANKADYKWRTNRNLY